LARGKRKQSSQRDAGLPSAPDPELAAVDERPAILSHWQAVVLLVVLVVCCYANSTGNGFHYDDIHTVVENDLTRSTNAWRVLLARPARFVTRYSFSVNWALAGFGRLWIWHAVNILTHALCGLLVYALSLRHGRASLSSGAPLRQ